MDSMLINTRIVHDLILLISILPDVSKCSLLKFPTGLIRRLKIYMNMNLIISSVPLLIAAIVDGVCVCVMEMAIILLESLNLRNIVCVSPSFHLLYA